MTVPLCRITGQWGKSKIKNFILFNCVVFLFFIMKDELTLLSKHEIAVCGISESCSGRSYN